MKHLRSSRHVSFAVALASTLVLSDSASAQAPTLNWGDAIFARFGHNTRSVSSGPDVAQSQLLLDVLLDTDRGGPYVLALEQGGRALATGSCHAEEVVYSGVLVDGQRFLRDCATSWVDTSAIRADRPVDVVLAYVDEASDDRTEIYRGSFPTVTFYDWGGSYPLERRQIRADSLFGVGFLHESIEGRVQFLYVTTNDGEQRHDSGMLRCRVNEGGWVGYDLRSVGTRFSTSVQNAPEGNTIAEQSFATEWIGFDASLPVVVRDGGRRPERGDELDGAWTCEFREGRAGRAVTQREFRFQVVHGTIQSHALEASLPVGRGTALATIGLQPAALPRVIDPALVRGGVGGRAVPSSSAPVVTNLPTRAAELAISSPPRASGARGARR